MRAIHLDTSFLIRSFSPDTLEARKLERWISDEWTVRISAIVWSEFLCGPVAGRAIDLTASFLGEPIAFDGLHAVVAAQLFNIGGRRRHSSPDCMIAAVALSADAALATSNRKDFERFAAIGLMLDQP